MVLDDTAYRLAAFFDPLNKVLFIVFGKTSLVMLSFFGSKLIAMSIKLSTVITFAILAVALRLWTWIAWLEPFVIYLHIIVSLLTVLNLYVVGTPKLVLLISLAIFASVYHPATYFIALVALFAYGNQMFMSFLLMTIMPFVVLNRGPAPLEELQGSLKLQGANPQAADDEDTVLDQPINQFLDQFPWHQVVAVIENEVIDDPEQLTSDQVAQALFQDLAEFGPSYTLHCLFRLSPEFILFCTVVETTHGLQDYFTQIEVPFHIGSRNGFPVLAVQLPFPFPIESPNDILESFCYVFPWNNSFTFTHTE